MTDTPACPHCGSERVAREDVHVVDRHTGCATVDAGWWCCFDCWHCWDGACDGDGILPPRVAARKERDERTL